MSKACTKCGEAKPLGEFHKRTAARDGRQSACKACACAAINKINTPTRPNLPLQKPRRASSLPLDILPEAMSWR
jgi:hypothetical protein